MLTAKHLRNGLEGLLAMWLLVTLTVTETVTETGKQLQTAGFFHKSLTSLFYEHYSGNADVIDAH